MAKFFDLSATAITDINRIICQASGEPHGPGPGNVESALHSTFFPGSPPFQHGGISEIAAAMSFYLAKAHAFINGNKRTAIASAMTFMQLNGYMLVYPGNALADVIVAAVINELTLDDLKLWFDFHKVRRL